MISDEFELFKQILTKLGENTQQILSRTKLSELFSQPDNKTSSTRIRTFCKVIGNVLITKSTSYPDRTSTKPV